MAVRARIELPPPLIPVFAPPRGDVRYRCAYGGRGSGKSYSFAMMALAFGYREPLRILCTREYQASIRESFHAELAGVIKAYPWLSMHYTVGESFINGANGTEFVFRGLRRNISSIRSMAAIDLCMIEEAEDIPESSWIDLLPTIRAPRSEVWCIWNPRDEESSVNRRFRKSVLSNAMVAECNYRDNPWLSDVLDAQRREDQARLDLGTYAYIWDGAYLRNSHAQILAGKVRIEEFVPEPGWDGPYHGLDWGFSQDPTAAVRCWVHDDRLWIEYEAGRTRLELDETAAYLRDRIPGIERYTVRADSARPESISHVTRDGLLHVIAVKKWPGSVEDGISHLLSYREIVIHPRCEQTIREARLYSYKTNQGGDPTREVIDAYNNYIDATRYALAPLIQARMVGGFGVRVAGL